MESLDLWPIGNCNVSALIDAHARFVWACVPRPDGDPVFCSLLAGEDRDECGYWSIELEKIYRAQQHYIRNSAVLRTEMRDDQGDAIEIIDFAPRAWRLGRVYRPAAFVRIVRPLAGSPRIVVRLRPTANWGGPLSSVTHGSNHIRYVGDATTLRLTTSAPVAYVLAERAFRLDGPLFFFLGPDESFAEPMDSLFGLCDATVRDWQLWVRSLALPLEWQDAVISAAIGLRLCTFEETGAIVAALTSSIPEARGSGRNWDYRYCWLRDAYYVVQALNRIGAVDILEGYLTYLHNVCDAAGGHLQPVYGIGLETQLEESIIDRLPGYRGDGPVRRGNQAWIQAQHDVYGQTVLPLAQTFLDRRLLRQPTPRDFERFEALGERAFLVHDKPDAGPWELRTSAAVHTYPALMCWAACDRIANVSQRIGKVDRGLFWRERADIIRRRIEAGAWNESLQSYTSAFGGDMLDASLLQLLDLKFSSDTDPKFLKTLARLESGLIRHGHAMRYIHADDFGRPENAFTIATFWYIEALARSGRREAARTKFEQLLALRTRAGLLSEDVDMHTGELWGNYPQTYSQVGIINAAVLLSEPWNMLR